MIWALFRKTLKQNWKLLLIFFAVLTMYMSIMISMYNPEDMASMLAMLDLLPRDLLNAMGFSNDISDLTSYLASWFYGLLMFGFPLVYCIILGNRLMAKMVDNKSFGYLLSTPNSRIKIVMTQGLYSLLSIFVLFAVLFGLGVGLTAAIFLGLLDVGAFLKINVVTMLVNMFVMMICFFFSCLFNESKQALGIASAITILSLLLNMLGNTSPDLNFLKKISFYGFYDPVQLAFGAEIWKLSILYSSLAIVLFVSGVLIFNKKRLPI